MNVQIVPKRHEGRFLTNGRLVNSESEGMCKEGSTASFRALSQCLDSLSSVLGIMVRLRPPSSAYRIPVEARNLSYNRSQRDGLFLNLILIYNSTYFGQTYCPSPGAPGAVLRSTQLPIQEVTELTRSTNLMQQL